MVRISVFYPHGQGKQFDMDYYRRKHIPTIQQTLGPALKSLVVEQGLGGMAAGSPPAYTVVCHLGFETMEKLQATMAAHGDAMMADLPNFTEVKPVVQISEVIID